MMRLFITLLLSCLFSQANAQTQISGFTPPILASIGFQVLYLQTIDPFTNQLKTINYANPASFEIGDGELIWKNSIGQLFAIVYDPNLGAWKNTSLISSNPTTSQIENHVVSWRLGSGSLGVAIYDPILQSWVKTILTSASNSFSHADGMVAWTTVTNQAYAAAFDPELSAWQTHLLGSMGGNSVMTRGGLVGWINSLGVVGMAHYNLRQHTWQEYIGDEPCARYDLGQGVMVWRNPNNHVHTVAYDVDREDWVDSIFGVINMGQTIGVSEGTAYYFAGQTINHIGYDNATKTWNTGAYTNTRCRNYVWQPNANPNGMAYLYSNVVGSDTSKYVCSDGFEVNARSAYKKFAVPDTYQVTSTIHNLFSSSTCQETVYITTAVGIEDATSMSCIIAPNPTTASLGFRIEAPQPIKSLRILNGIGQQVYACLGLGTSMHISLDHLRLPSGMYIVETALGRNQISRNKIILQ
jgi:hypothetical protein